MSLTQDELKELLQYHPLLGVFTWKVKPASWIHVGDIAGHIARNGYVQIRLKKVLYYAHRLAVLYMTGAPPVNQVDHINGDTSDTRWANLREATHTENMRNCARGKNNSSGVNGVLWDKQKNKWMAHITVHYKKKFLGYFDDIPAAAAAREAANRTYNFHPNHGRIQ